MRWSPSPSREAGDSRAPSLLRGPFFTNRGVAEHAVDGRALRQVTVHARGHGILLLPHQLVALLHRTMTVGAPCARIDVPSVTEEDVGRKGVHAPPWDRSVFPQISGKHSVPGLFAPGERMAVFADVARRNACALPRAGHAVAETALCPGFGMNTMTEGKRLNRNRGRGLARLDFFLHDGCAGRDTRRRTGRDEHQGKRISSQDGGRKGGIQVRHGCYSVPRQQRLRPAMGVPTTAGVWCRISHPGFSCMEIVRRDLRLYERAGEGEPCMCIRVAQVGGTGRARPAGSSTAPRSSSGRI